MEPDKAQADTMLPLSTPTPTPSGKTKEELHRRLIEALHENGSMPMESRLQLITMLVGDIWEIIYGMPERLKTLEENSILIQARTHKGTTTLWLVGIALFFYTLHDALPWLVAHVRAILHVF